jgi:hypothetical protein
MNAMAVIESDQVTLASFDDKLDGDYDEDFQNLALQTDHIGLHNALCEIATELSDLSQK